MRGLPHKTLDAAESALNGYLAARASVREIMKDCKGLRAMIIRETMDSYLARVAVSSSMAWDIVNECPAYAYARSPFCPEPCERTSTDRMDFGTIAHLAVLENHLLHDRVLLVSEKDWRTKGAREMKDVAIKEGKTALLMADFKRVQEVRKAIEASEAAHYFFSEGESEVSYVWEWDGVPCKARIDRLARGDGSTTLVHLKTSQSANPNAFAQVCGRLGYDLTAAWYLDGWQASQGPEADFDDYVFVVVASEAPHMVTVMKFDDDDLAGGRTLYRRALAMFREARETGVWRGYGQRPGIQTLRMPAWYRRAMFEMEGASRG